MPDLASQEWPLKQCFNPGTLVAHWKARFTSLPVSPLLTVSQTPKNTLQWPHFGPTVQPLGDPWTKRSQRTGLNIFSFSFICFIIFFFLRTQVARNKTSGYTVTKYPPVTPLWANSTTVRRPLGKMKPKDWFRQFLFYFRTQVARNKTPGYMVTQNPPVTPLWANSTTVRRPLGKMKPKDWFRQFFPFLLFSDSSCEEQDIWLSWS